MIDKFINKLKFNKQGLIPVIIQDAKDKDVLMFAFMNNEALGLTLKTKRVHFFSRSRNKLWLKGETSGHIQTVKKVFFDCDSDALLILAHQVKAACHTGFRSCFYRCLDKNAKVRIVGKKVFDPDAVYKK